jgi:hypothetical protein
MKMYTGNIFQFSCLIITENICNYKNYGRRGHFYITMKSAFVS